MLCLKQLFFFLGGGGGAWGFRWLGVAPLVCEEASVLSGCGLTEDIRSSKTLIPKNPKRGQNMNLIPLDAYGANLA